MIITLPAQQSSAQEAGDPGRDYFVSASVNNTAPYVGQSFIYTLQFYARILPGDVSEELPQFMNFWLGSIRRNDDRRVTLDGNQYILTEFIAELAGLHAGPTTIDAARIIVPETPFRSGSELTSEAIALDIRELPPGAPPEFSGAVGQIDVAFELGSNQTTAGEPISLAVKISGAGELARLPAPQVGPISGWRIYRNPPSYDYNNLSGLAFGEKRFEWLLVPFTTGSQTLPAVAYTYFDPIAEAYRSIESPAYTIEVFPGDSSDSQPGTADEQAPVIVQPIGPLLHNPGGIQNAPPAGAWVGPAVLVFVTIAWTMSRRFLERRHIRARRSGAKERALQRLGRLNALDPMTRHEAILQVVRSYVADCTGRRVAESPPALLKTLKAHNNHLTAVEDLYTRLSVIDGRRYAPAPALADVTIDTEIIAQLIADLDTSWR